MQVIVINLASAIKRRQFQEKQLQELSLNHIILDATSIDDISDEVYQKHYYDWQRPLRRSEVACYFSHKRCWESVIESNKPALIIEDDALFSPRVSNILSQLEKYKNIDLVDLEVTGRKKNVSKTKLSLNDDSHLLRVYLNSSGAGGYVLYPSGAKKLLNREKKEGISLADAHIATCGSLLAYQVEPAAIVQFIMCPFYEINHPSILSFCSSSTNEERKKIQGLRFKLKRGLSEIKLGVKKLLLMSISERRYVHLKKNDFI